MGPEGENLIDLLGQAQDIVEPGPVSMLPATPAWAVAALFVFAVLAFLTHLLLRRRRGTAYRRAALIELRGLRSALASGDPGALVHLDQLMRRTALVAFPRHEVASLTGDDWIAFLDRTGGSFQPYGDILAYGPYRAAGKLADQAALAGAARHWIAHHHA